MRHTCPGTIHGEGPTETVNRTSCRSSKNKAFTAEDIRFTAREGVLYAIPLEWPKSRQVVIKSLAAGSEFDPGRIEDVALLGSSADLEWSRDKTGLHVSLPAQSPCDHAYVLKLTLAEN